MPLPLLLAPAVANRRADAAAGGVFAVETGVAVPGVTTEVCRWAEGATPVLLDTAGLRAGAARAAEEEDAPLKDTAAAAARGVLSLLAKSSSDKSLLESLSSPT